MSRLARHGMNPTGPTMSFLWGYAAGYRRGRAASCDTQPKAGDVQQAPLVSGAVGKAETP